MATTRRATKKATTTVENNEEAQNTSKKNVVATFEKVSFEQYYKDFLDTYGEEFDRVQVKDIYDSIKLPQRGTSGSAGYDFFTPQTINLATSKVAKIPTGIRVKIDDGWFLAVMPRSGLGFKYKVQLYNTVGVIDSDYYNSSNEGHIFVKIVNDNGENKAMTVNKGDGFVQGIFLPYGLATDDNTTTVRDGGFGSTTK